MDAVRDGVALGISAIDMEVGKHSHENGIGGQRDIGWEVVHIRGDLVIASVVGSEICPGAGVRLSHESKGSVRSECIGMSGCDASPDRYGGSLNRARGLTQCEPH